MHFDCIQPAHSHQKRLQAVHGSGFFQRGDTQLLATATVGVDRSPQAMHRSATKEDRRLVLHYR